MRVTKPLADAWIEQFNKLFHFHPDRENIMEEILSDNLISRGQFDKWFYETNEYAHLRLQAQLQEISEA